MTDIDYRFLNRPKKQIGVGGLRLGLREKWEVLKVLNSNRLSYGPYSEKFEKDFASLHDCRYASFCNSGTSALHIALAALKEKYGWSDGDEVLVPAITFIATSNVVLHNNMRPIFVDVDPRTYNIDPSQLDKHRSSRTRAIIPVHLMGLPADMDPILDFAARYNLKVIEDSAETMFARYKGRKVGSLGDIGAFSTYVAHYIVTGVGGLATTNDPDLAIRLKSLMNHGRDSIYLKIDDDQNIPRERLYEIVSKRFSFVSVGHSFRATEMEAAIGLVQLAKRDWVIRKRKQNAEFLIRNLRPFEDRVQLPQAYEGAEHMFMLFPLVLRNEGKEALVQYLEEHLVETRDLMPLLNQPVYKRIFGADLESCYPVAHWINLSGFYIGCHEHLSTRDLRYIVQVFEDFFRTH